jgi:hypothetical protein
VDAALYGLTDQKPENLIVLARSWIYPPEMRVLTTGIDSDGYDFSQRAYRLEGKGKPAQIDFSLSGSPDSPVYNPAFIIRNYPESECVMKVDGRTLKRGPDFRYGFTYDVEGVPTLLVWIKMSSEKPVQFQLGRE